MAFKPFKKINVNNNETISPKHINAVQDNISQALGQLLGKDQLDNQVLTNITLLPAITNKVPHQLGRRLSGWIVVRNHGGYSMLTDLQDTNASPHLLLYLYTPALVVVDLFVF